MNADSTVVFSDEMKAFITRLRLCYVATVNEDNTPNVSPRGTLKVLDDDHLIFADIMSPNTSRNITRNPAIEINIVDPFLRRGYRFKGNAILSSDPGLIDKASQDLGANYPVRQVIVVKVSHISTVRSPVYVFTEQTESEIQATWARIYGSAPP